jgi:hypothetical protein
MKRILKPSGHLIFVEHGRSGDPGVEAWQDRITPLWKHIAGGCHLNRKIDGRPFTAVASGGSRSALRMRTVAKKNTRRTKLTGSFTGSWSCLR